MLVISIPADDLYMHPKIEETINGRVFFVIVVAERYAFFYRIHDQQNVLASKIFYNRPI